MLGEYCIVSEALLFWYGSYGWVGLKGPKLNIAQASAMANNEVFERGQAYPASPVNHLQALRDEQRRAKSAMRHVA